MESESAMSKQMIIAMKGHSSSHNTEIAQKIASFLKCPLINEDDILPTLQKSLPSTSYRRLSRDSNIEFIFDIVSQISSTQINLNLSVVINMQLSGPAHYYDRLEQLANSTGATLIIIHGKTERDQGGHDVGVGNAPTVSVDATKPFLLEELARLMLQAAITNESIDYDKPKGDVLAASPSDHNKSNERDLGDMHVHEFEFCVEPKKEKVRCTKCEKLIDSGPTYHCIECDDFILHKDCASSPTLEKLLERDQHRFLMKNPPEKYDFSSQIDGCQFCHEFTSSCPDCLLRATIKGEYLPTIYKFGDHEHPLNFIIMPFSFNYEYECCACHEMGKFVSYKCFQCNYDLHTKCTIHGRSLLFYLPDRYTDFALMTTKDVIPRINDVIKGVQTMKFRVDKLLSTNQRLKKQQQIVLADSLNFYDGIHAELYRISTDLSASSVDETLPLQHDEHFKGVMKYLNTILEELYRRELYLLQFEGKKKGWFLV